MVRGEGFDRVGAGGTSEEEERDKRESQMREGRERRERDGRESVRLDKPHHSSNEVTNDVHSAREAVESKANPKHSISSLLSNQRAKEEKQEDLTTCCN